MDLGLWRDIASEGSNFSGLLLPKESVSFPWLLTLQQPPDSFPVVAIMHAARKREVWWVGKKRGRKTSPLAQASHQPLLPHLGPRAGEWNKFYEIENLNCQQSTKKNFTRRKVQFLAADKFARIIDDNVFFMKLCEFCWFSLISRPGFVSLADVSSSPKIIIIQFNRLSGLPWHTHTSNQKSS